MWPESEQVGSTSAAFRPNPPNFGEVRADRPLGRERCLSGIWAGGTWAAPYQNDHACGTTVEARGITLCCFLDRGTKETPTFATLLGRPPSFPVVVTWLGIRTRLRSTLLPAQFGWQAWGTRLAMEIPGCADRSTPHAIFGRGPFEPQWPSAGAAKRPTLPSCRPYMRTPGSPRLSRYDAPTCHNLALQKRPQSSSSGVPKAPII